MVQGFVPTTSQQIFFLSSEVTSLSSSSSSSSTAEEAENDDNYKRIPGGREGVLAAYAKAAELSSLQYTAGGAIAPTVPEYDPSMIERARVPLSWERETSSTNWEEGQVWHETREQLAVRWILPRDTSLGLDPRYTKAANKWELETLNVIPALFRLPTVVPTVNLLLELGFRPPFLRSEPRLLSIPPGIIRSAWDFHLVQDHGSDKEALKACNGQPRLLHDAIDSILCED